MIFISSHVCLEADEIQCLPSELDRRHESRIHDLHSAIDNTKKWTYAIGVSWMDRAEQICKVSSVVRAAIMWRQSFALQAAIILSVGGQHGICMSKQISIEHLFCTVIRNVLQVCARTKQSMYGNLTKLLVAGFLGLRNSPNWEYWIDPGRKQGLSRAVDRIRRPLASSLHH